MLVAAELVARVVGDDFLGGRAVAILGLLAVADLEELAAEYAGKVKIVKVNVDENPESPAALGVRGIPALFMFKDGKVVSNKIGAAPKAALKAWIDENV